MPSFAPNSYIHASQCGIVRLNKQTAPNEIAGLCTDGLSFCLCFVLIGKDKQKISLIHTAMEANEQAIIDECQHVGYPCEVFVLKGIFYANPFYENFRITRTDLHSRLDTAVKDLPITINNTHLDKATFAATVNRAGEIALIQTMFGTKHPQVELRTAINLINVYNKSGLYHGLDINLIVKTGQQCLS